MQLTPIRVIASAALAFTFFIGGFIAGHRSPVLAALSATPSNSPVAPSGSPSPTPSPSSTPFTTFDSVPTGFHAANGKGAQEFAKTTGGRPGITQLTSCDDACDFDLVVYTHHRTADSKHCDPGFHCVWIHGTDGLAGAGADAEVEPPVAAGYEVTVMLEWAAQPPIFR